MFSVVVGGVCRRSRCRIDADMVEEEIERTIDGGVQVIEFAAAIIGHHGAVSEWLDDSRAEWGVDALEELEEQHADADALWTQAVGLALRHFENQAFGTEFGEVVAQLAETVGVGSHAEGFR